jgi:hypothetical protein
MTTDEKLTAILAKHGKSNCPKCGRLLDRGDVAWNNADTEAGTPFTWVEIQCQQCDTEIAHFSSWWPGADDLDELVENVLANDWR